VHRGTGTGGRQENPEGARIGGVGYVAARRTVTLPPPASDVLGHDTRNRGDTRVTHGYRMGMPTDTARTAGSTLASRDRVRLTFDVPTEDANALAVLARRTGYNKVTTLLRALRVLADLDQVIRDGGSVVLEHADGTRERLLLR